MRLVTQLTLVVQVACHRLDTLMDQGVIPKTRLMKVDVEGVELDVLRGAEQLISRDRPAVPFEYNL